MKNLKGIFTVIGLLSLGFIGGFFTHRQVTIQQVQQVREIGQAPGFQRHLLEFLAPDAAQREQLEPIIARYAQQMGAQWREHQQERRVLVEAMHKEINPLLSEEQVRQLDEFSRRVRGRRDRNGKTRELRQKRPERTGKEN